MTNADYVSNGWTSNEYDLLFEVLAHHHRRILLHQLVEDEIADVDDLADVVSERVAVDRSRFMTVLIHKHLPKLDETAIVDSDP